MKIYNTICTIIMIIGMGVCAYHGNIAMTIYYGVMALLFEKNIESEVK